MAYYKGLISKTITVRVRYSSLYIPCRPLQNKNVKWPCSAGGINAINDGYFFAFPFNLALNAHVSALAYCTDLDSVFPLQVRFMHINFIFVVGLVFIQRHRKTLKWTKLFLKSAHVPIGTVSTFLKQLSSYSNSKCYTLSKGHFRVLVCLCFKTSLGAKTFI